MTHPEWIYLLKLAHTVFNREEECEAQEATYHAVETFLPLSSGVLAQLRIRRPEPGKPPVLALRVRHQPDQSEVVELSSRVLVTPVKLGTVKEEGFEETVFLSETVPPTVI